MSYACHLAYTAYATREPIENALKETEMWNVYRKIELPLIFTLDSMENGGFVSKARNLKLMERNSKFVSQNLKS